MNSRRQVTVTAVGILLGFALLWLSLRDADLGVAWQRVANARAWDIVGIVICSIAFAVVKAARWQWLLRHLHRVSLSRLLAIVVAGSAVNYAVAHAGEVVRSWMLARTHRVPQSATLTSIGVERAFDFAAVLALGVAALQASGVEHLRFGGYLWALGALIGLLLVFLLPCLFWPRGAVGALARIVGHQPGRAGQWLLRQVDHAVSGVASLRSPLLVLRTIIASLLQWTLMGGCAWLSLTAVGVATSFATSMVVVLVLVAGLTLPAAPGHVGTTQAAFLVATTPFGVSATDALAASFLYNLVVPLSFVVPGAILLVLERNRRASYERLDPSAATRPTTTSTR